MRTINSIRNISISIITQIIMVFLGFISRKIFIDNLGAEYLGINGVMTNIISVLGLVESGIGTSIVYSLYKPLAEKNKPMIISLVNLYKKIYRYISIVILLISFCMYPIVNSIVEGSNINKLVVAFVFFIFVAQNIVSYLYAYKWALIGADQKGYIIAQKNLIFSVLITIIKIIVLSIYKNYILYLGIEFIFTLLQNYINGKVVDKLYPYINTNEIYNLDEVTKQSIVKNVKALFIHKIGSKMVFGTDNILISAFVSVKTVGIYSNYTLIIKQLEAILAPIIYGTGESIGNLIATEDEDKTYFIFNIIYMINFWIYSFCVVFLFNLLEPFISWWIGEIYILDKLTFVIILINFYLTGMRASINIFKSKAGAFQQDKFMPIIESIINLLVSIILVKHIGLPGIFIGTTVSTIAVPLWTQAYVVYKYIFRCSLVEYFTKYIKYIILTIFTGIITTFICNTVFTNYTFLSLVGRGLICVIIPNTLLVMVFYNTEEFKYILKLLEKINLSKKYMKGKKINA